jgi:hypothetical protein
MCGCGQTTKISKWDDKKTGTVKGGYHRYLTCHWTRKHGPGLPPGVIALYDPEDAPLIERYAWFVDSGGYLRCTPAKGQKTESLHRMIMAPPPEMEVDHINGNRLDNRRANLRVVTKRENSANRRASGASGFRGVTRVGDKWVARAILTIGTYATAAEAGAAAREWRLKNMPGATD